MGSPAQSYFRLAVFAKYLGLINSLRSLPEYIPFFLANTIIA